MTVLAAMPVIIAVLMLCVRSGAVRRGFEKAVLSAMLAGSIAPLVVLAIAAAAFANEVEDRTLANLTLSPLPRWQIALPKLLAAITIAARSSWRSAFVTSWVAFLGDVRADRGVTVSALVGVALYSSAFVLARSCVDPGDRHRPALHVCGKVFLGLRGRRAAAQHPALRHRADARAGRARFAWATNLDASAAAAVTLLGVGGFVWLSVRRLRRMDVP